MKYTICYTEQYVTCVEAKSKKAALAMFENGDFEKGEYVEGSTEIVGEVKLSEQN